VEDLDLEALELTVRQQVLRLAGRVVEQFLNADTSDRVGPRAPCPCGGEARYAGRRGKPIESVFGPLRLQRACMTGTVGSMLSFQEGSELLKVLAGVGVDAKQVERTAEALGKEIAEDERCHMEPSDTLPLPETLYLGIDGTGIPLRAEELAGTTGKQPDGSAKTREVKLCTVWSAESLDEHGIPVRDRGSVT
jgi:hypothetical protein